MTKLLFLGSFGMPEILIVAFLILIFFGGKRIPELMRGVGKGIRSFKDGVKGVEDQIKLDDEDSSKKTDSNKNIE